jgi:hypothetical protein
MHVRRYNLGDGETINIGVEVGQWSAWLEGRPLSQVIGFPLEGVLMEVIGLNPAHDDVPPEIEDLAERVRRDVPRAEWPKGPLTLGACAETFRKHRRRRDR